MSRKTLAPLAPLVIVLASLAGGCASLTAKQRTYEAFDSTTRFSRTVAGSAAQACEAARRALLSQGYVVTVQVATQLGGRKNFQLEDASHLQIELQVVCADDVAGSQRSLVFASALQDRYELKKGASSASVGVGAVGSLSLPFAAGNESLVRVSSETVTSDLFYDRFFAVVDRYLILDE